MSVALDHADAAGRFSVDFDREVGRAPVRLHRVLQEFLACPRGVGMREAVAQLTRDLRVVGVPHERRRHPSCASAERCNADRPAPSEQRPSFLPQPALGLAEVRADLFDQPPVPPRVVLLPQMHQLVQEHVIADSAAASARAGSSARSRRCASTSPSASAGSGCVTRFTREAVLRGELVQPRHQRPLRDPAERRFGGCGARSAGRRQGSGPAVADVQPAMPRGRRSMRSTRRLAACSRIVSPACHSTGACCAATRRRSCSAQSRCLATKLSASRRDPPRGIVTRSVPSGRTRRMYFRARRTRTNSSLRFGNDRTREETGARAARGQDTTGATRDQPSSVAAPIRLPVSRS